MFQNSSLTKLKSPVISRAALCFPKLVAIPTTSQASLILFRENKGPLDNTFLIFSVIYNFRVFKTTNPFLHQAICDFSFLSKTFLFSEEF